MSRLVISIIATVLMTSAGFAQNTGKTAQNQSKSSSSSVSSSTSSVETAPSQTKGPAKDENTEYIAVGAKEKGFKLYIEGGGGTMVNGGVIWRLNSIFGVGAGVGYTSPPYRNYGVSVTLKTETVPLWFDMDYVKLNLLVGLNGVIFFGSGTQYMAALVGMEALIKQFQLLVPSVNVYLYLAGGNIVPQLSGQIRYSF